MKTIEIKIRLPEDTYKVIKEKAEAEHRSAHKQVVHQLVEANKNHA